MFFFQRRLQKLILILKRKVWKMWRWIGATGWNSPNSQWWSIPSRWFRLNEVSNLIAKTWMNEHECFKWHSLDTVCKGKNVLIPEMNPIISITTNAILSESNVVISASLDRSSWLDGCPLSQSRQERTVSSWDTIFDQYLQKFYLPSTKWVRLTG